MITRETFLQGVTYWCGEISGEPSGAFDRTVRRFVETFNAWAEDKEAVEEGLGFEWFIGQCFNNTWTTYYDLTKLIQTWLAPDMVDYVTTPGWFHVTGVPPEYSEGFRKFFRYPYRWKAWGSPTNWYEVEYREDNQVVIDVIPYYADTGELPEHLYLIAEELKRRFEEGPVGFIPYLQPTRGWWYPVGEGSPYSGIPLQYPVVDTEMNQVGVISRPDEWLYLDEVGSVFRTTLAYLEPPNEFRKWVLENLEVYLETERERDRAFPTPNDTATGVSGDIIDRWASEAFGEPVVRVILEK